MWALRYEAALFLERIALDVHEKGDTNRAQEWKDEVASLYEKATTGIS